jgi:hypothetical protein
MIPVRRGQKVVTALSSSFNCTALYFLPLLA